MSLWGPAVIWMAVIFIVSSIPDLPAPPGGLSDTAAHGAEYAILGALLLRGFASARWAGVTVVAVLLSIATAAAYGALDELYQAFVPGRTRDVGDLIADATGAATATGALWAWGIIRRLSRRHVLQESGRRASRGRRDPHDQPS